MDYEILYKCEAEQNIKCYVCKANLKDYIASLKPDFYEFEVQRGIVRNSYLDTLRQTISNKEPIPPISLTVSGEPVIDNQILKVKDENSDILDGLQRTFRLWVYNYINNIVKSKNILTFSELVSELKSDDIGTRIIDFYFINTKFLKDFLPIGICAANIQSFIDGWENYNLIFYIWYGLDDKQVVRKMLELNAGQKPVTSTHQYELLYLHFFNNEKIQIPEGMQLIRVRDPYFFSIRRGRNKLGQFLLSSVIIAYQSFIKRKPLRVQTANEVRVDDDNDDDIQNFFNPDNLNSFLKYMYIADSILCNQDTKHLAWYGKDTTLSGIYAALGQYMYENGNELEWDKLDYILNNKVKKMHFNVDQFEEAYNRLSSIKTNVGYAVRKAIYKFTLNALQSHPVSWYECLINKDSEL